MFPVVWSYSEALLCRSGLGLQNTASLEKTAVYIAKQLFIFAALLPLPLYTLFSWSLIAKINWKSSPPLLLNAECVLLASSRGDPQIPNDPQVLCGMTCKTPLCVHKVGVSCRVHEVTTLSVFICPVMCCPPALKSTNNALSALEILARQSLTRNKWKAIMETIRQK